MDASCSRWAQHLHSILHRNEISQSKTDAHTLAHGQGAIQLSEQ